MPLSSPIPNFAASPDQLVSYAESMGHGELHIKIDKEAGLHAIVSIHNTNLGPALGGCRFLEYNSASEAIYDAMRLARGMSYKSAISGLPLGGGKAVIIRPKIIKDRTALFEKFGEFVETLGGRYLTAVDSGTSVEDMDIIHHKTNYVTSTSRNDETHGDPSYSTARGVLRGIEAAAKFRLGRATVDGLHIAIQGAGHVGYFLAKKLHNAGAKISICDMNIVSAQRCADEFGATIVDPATIFSTQCDVFAPCALGAILNSTTIPLLNTKIVAGSANNQLATAEDSNMLMERGILYVPDYVINAGGLIDVYCIYQNKKMDDINTAVDKIYDTVYTICEKASQTGLDPAKIADELAISRIYGNQNQP